MHEFLSHHLVEPNTLSTVVIDEVNSLVKSSGGNEYHIVNGIPVVIDTSTKEAQHVRHYTTDAEQFDYFEERDAATEHDEERLRQTILRRVDKYTQSVLDVGCGRAWVARALCPRGVFVCSMDVSTTNPRKALEIYPFSNHAALVADAYALPFRDGTFDCVIGSEIIEHVPDPAGFVKELLRVVKRGGKLIVSTPYKEKIKYVLCIHCNQKTPLHAHIHSFDERVLKLLNDRDDISYSWETLGNKVLLFARTYIALKYLPYPLWRLLDTLANLIINKRLHIVVEWTRD
jgi:SAM-dependent methyltransferase